MGKIKAKELVAHGWSCDDLTCDTVTPVRNSESRAPGYYIDIERVTDGMVRRVNRDQLFFCSKECMLNALEFQFSSMTDVRVGPLPRSVPGQQYELRPKKLKKVERTNP